ncbi:MAG: protein kinase [Lachnospiraceae bacterium]|nr:protein kinase [Lachnospiraceae bacterium]
MNNDIAMECEKSFYKELYQFEDKKQTLIIDETTKKLYLKKRLAVWNIDALNYLRQYRNPHVAYIQNFWNENNEMVVIEEYVQGDTLENAYMEGRLSEAMLQYAILCVLDGAAFLHCARPPIIHRDIKTENIIVTPGGEIKLIDFDAAKAYKGDRERDTVLFGTPGSAAPEQYGFSESDPRTDIYAIGELIRRFFATNPYVMQVAEKATRMDPRDRYPTVNALRKDFMAAIGFTKGMVTDPELSKEWSIVRGYDNLLKQKEYEINDLIARLRAGQPLPVALSAVTTLNLTNAERMAVTHYQNELRRQAKEEARPRIGFWGAFFKFLAYVFIACALGLTVMYVVHMIY